MSHAMRHASAAWEDAGSNCTDQFSDALAVNVTGSVDRTTVGTYTITYDCTENSGSKILAPWIDLSTVVSTWSHILLHIPVCFVARSSSDRLYKYCCKHNSWVPFSCLCLAHQTLGHHRSLHSSSNFTSLHPLSGPPEIAM